MSWKRLCIESREEIQKYLKNKFETSDLNFTNLFLWSFSENIEFKIKNEILYIRGTYEDEKYYFTPISKDDNISSLLEAFKKIISKQRRIVFIPEKYKQLLEDNIEFVEERDSFDYIYLQEDLATLKGRKFSSKKNKVNKFKKIYDYTYSKITKDNIEEVRSFQRKWMDERINKDSILISESAGIEKILDNYDKLNLRGGFIKVDGNIVAYAIGEKLNDELAVIHIEKGIVEYLGSYQMINQYLAKEEFDDVKYINREDDFGSLGLREAKLSYNPVKLLKKYTIKN